MPTIRDTQMKSVYTSWESTLRDRPDFKVDGQGMIKLLAAIGDLSSKEATQVETELSRPGITRDEQLAIVKAGLDDAERSDLGKILDEGQVPLADDVKKFLGQVIDRTPVDPNDGALRVTGDQAGGVIQGTAAPGSTIEAINLSTAPNKRLHTDDTFNLATVGADGKFSGRMPEMQEGDIIRLRQRDRAGTVSNWMKVVTGGMGVDARNAEVALFRVGLHDQGNGKVELTNINSSRQLSEPGAKIKFVNERTNDEKIFTMNDEGTFDGVAELPGKKGDVFSVRASDGRNNADFRTEVGKVTVPGSTGGGSGVDLPDPVLHKDELDADGKPKFEFRRFTGPLYETGAVPEDVMQGQIGDCYLPSAVAALAKAKPGIFEDIIKENGDGTYTVTFKQRDGWGGAYKDVPIKVDGDLPVRSWGGPLYGRSANSRETDKMELWWPLFEKAYATWRGQEREGKPSYNAIGSGGHSSSVFEAALGRPSDDKYIGFSDADAVWDFVKQKADAKLPLSAGTHGEEDKALYTNTGVYPDHSYSIYGYEEKDGVKYVKLRNPWGESEPYPGDGVDDGIFSLKLDDFMKLYSTIYSVE